MKEFFIGCRISEIENISPSADETYPTLIRFKSGSSAVITGKWSENVKKLESILAGNAEESKYLEARLDSLRAEVRTQERRLKEIDATVAAHRPKLEADEDLTKVAVWLSQTSRAYMRADERAALARLIGVDAQ